MEKYTMFMDWKNHCSENEYTTQSNLQIQCNPYQATSDSTKSLVPRKRNTKKEKWLSEEALQIAVKRREEKSNGEKERYTPI